MNKFFRKTVIVGNWKMNKTANETKMLVEEIAKGLPNNPLCDVVVCPSYISLNSAVSACEGTTLFVGAQNCHYSENGAFTGEVSPTMLVDAGVSHVILGHSERRRDCGETDETVNLRLKAAIKAGLLGIICVGDTYEEHERGDAYRVCAAQVTAALAGIKEEELDNVIIAYEPIWAIGTGKSAGADEAGEICNSLRGLIAELYEEGADTISILYGGSMNAENAAEFLAKEDIDGGLIGGSSLKPAEFISIVKAGS